MDTNYIQSVQRKPTKIIHNIRNLHSQEIRRVRSDLEVFKLFKRINKGDNNGVLNISNQDRSLTNGLKVDKSSFKEEIGKR